MNYQSISDIFFADACLVYILAGIFCALVRWFHVCGPYSGDAADYYYPARKQLTFFYAVCVLQFPYVLDPSNEAAWIYVSIFGILYYPVCFALLFRRYFDRKNIYDSWRGLLFTVLPLVVLCALCITSMVCGKWVESHWHALMIAGGTMSLLLMSYTGMISVQLKRKIDKYHYDNYSCEQDFPYKFARTVVYLPFFWFILSWTVFLTDSRWVKFGADIVMTVWMVVFLLKVLHPQRPAPAVAEDEEDGDGSDGKPENAAVSSLKESAGGFADEGEREEIHRELVGIIEKLYLNSGLLKTEVIDRIDYGKKTLAKEYIAEVGFYNFVNAFRLEHARLYRDAHPQATLDQIAEEAGFRDRFALNYAKNKITFDYSNLIGDFHPDIT